MTRESGRQSTMAAGRADAGLRKWEREAPAKEPWPARLRTAAGRWVDTQTATALERDTVPLLALLRRFKPVLVTPRFTLILRNTDTRAVLADPDAFTVDLYSAKMERILSGFALAVDDPAAHAASRAVIDQAFLPGDIERLAARTATLATDAVAAARRSGAGELDLVADLARPVLGQAVAEHLGIPAPDPARFARWTCEVFREVFLNPIDDQAVARRADAAHAELRAVVTPALGRPAPQGTVLRRFQDAGLAPDVMAGNLIALAVAWIPNTAKSFTLAVAELFGRSDALAGACRAARDGDDERLAGYVEEALRFRVPHAGVPRLCVRARQLSGTTIPAGTPVVALTKSAMRDSRAVDEPRRFRPDRPSADYLNLGFGRHTCLGAPVSRLQMAALARPVLREPGLDRVDGRRGRILWDGPYPARLLVRLR